MKLARINRGQWKKGNKYFDIGMTTEVSGHTAKKALYKNNNVDRWATFAPLDPYPAYTLSFYNPVYIVGLKGQLKSVQGDVNVDIMGYKGNTLVFTKVISPEVQRL